MLDYVRVLKYPFLGWLIVDTVNSVSRAILPEMNSIPLGGIPLLLIGSLAFGAWVGYRSIEFKGSVLEALIAGVLTGAWCALLDITEFALIPAYGSNFIATLNIMDELPFSLYLVVNNLTGAFLGGGFASAKLRKS